MSKLQMNSENRDNIWWIKKFQYNHLDANKNSYIKIWKRLRAKNKILRRIKTYLLIFIFLIWFSLWKGGTIAGSISFTPTTIRTSATYTFQLTNSRILQASEVI